MRMRYPAAFMLLPLLLLPVPAQAQMYRWVDDNGKVHFSDLVPPAGAKNVKKQSRIAAQASSAPLPYALQQAAKNFPVTLYVSEACGDNCVQAGDLLKKRGVPFSEISIADETDLEKLKTISGGSSVPVLTVGREVYTGFASGTYKTALDSAGYPASSLLPPGVQARQPVAKPVEKAAAAEGAPAAAPPKTADTAAPKQ